MNEEQVYLMCPPNHYGIYYSINYWMDTNIRSSRQESFYQWNRLFESLSQLVTEVITIEPVAGLPDMVFVANAGLVLENKIILSRFKYKERQGEEEVFYRFFHDLGYEVVKPSKYFEGAGDCLFMGDIPICGYGFRSDADVYKEFFDDFVLVRLINEKFYHLDTCFCYLEGGYYLVYADAFDEESLRRMESCGCKPLHVSREDAEKFCCNAVNVGNHVILPSGCEKTVAMLRDNGYVCHEVDMSEFIKAGGACKCLTLRLR